MKERLMKKLRFSIDIDGVIGDLARKIPVVIKKLYDLDITYEDLMYYDLYQLLGISKYEGKEFYKELCYSFDGVPLMPGAIESIYELESRGHEITIVTKRWEREATCMWLDSIGVGHFPIVFLNDNEKMVNVDIILDDSPTKISELLPWVVEEAFLMAQPNNKYCLDVLNRFTRVDGWSDFMTHVERLERR